MNWSKNLLVKLRPLTTIAKQKKGTPDRVSNQPKVGGQGDGGAGTTVLLHPQRRGEVRGVGEWLPPGK